MSISIKFCCYINPLIVGVILVSAYLQITSHSGDIWGKWPSAGEKKFLTLESRYLSVWTVIQQTPTPFFTWKVVYSNKPFHNISCLLKAGPFTPFRLELYSLPSTEISASKTFYQNWKVTFRELAQISVTWSIVVSITSGRVYLIRVAV